MAATGVVELAADKDLQGDTAFEASFPPTSVGEITIECDPKKSGPPVVVLSSASGAKQELHPAPVRGRDGRYSARVTDASPFSSLRLTIARGMKAHVVKVRLIPRMEHKTPAPAPTPAPKPRHAPPSETPKA